MSSFGRLPKKYQNVCVDIVVQWGRELVSMCLDQGFNCSQCMKRISLPAMQSSLVRRMSGVVCLCTMSWNNLRWDAASSPPFTSPSPPSSPRPAPHLWLSSPCSSMGGYFSNHSFTGREEKDRSENTDLYMRHSPQFNYSPAFFTLSPPSAPYFIFGDKI